jgi:hypothetical protein
MSTAEEVKAEMFGDNPSCFCLSPLSVSQWTTPEKRHDGGSFA